MKIRRMNRALRCGTGFLIFIIALIIIIVMGGALASAATIKKTEEHKKKIKLTGETRLKVKNARGDTKIVGKKNLKIITIKAIKKIRAASEEDAKELLEGLTFEIEQDGDKVSIITYRPGKKSYKKGFFDFLSRHKRRALIDYYIEVPRFMDAEVACSSGDVAIAGIEGYALVRCTSGDVELRNVGGDAKVELSSGDINVDDIGGDLFVRTASGDAELVNIGKSLDVRATSGDVKTAAIGGNADISLVSGDLYLKGCRGDVSAESSSGDIILIRVDGNITASASSGDIIVTIAPNQKREYDLSTASGDVEINYHTPDEYGFLLEVSTGSGAIAGDMTIKMEKISRRYLKGIVGSGKASLKISTASGDIEVREASKDD